MKSTKKIVSLPTSPTVLDDGAYIFGDRPADLDARLSIMIPDGVAHLASQDDDTNKYQSITDFKYVSHWKSWSGSVSDFLVSFTSFIQMTDKGSPWFVPITVENVEINAKRSKGAVTGRTAVIFDIDDGMSVSDVFERMQASGLVFAIYTSHSHGRRKVNQDIVRVWAEERDLYPEDASGKLTRDLLNRWLRENHPHLKQPKFWRVEGQGNTKFYSVADPSVQKCRVIIPYAAPFLLSDCPDFETFETMTEGHALELAENLGIPVNKTTGQLSRLFHGPAHREGYPRWSAINWGEDGLLSPPSPADSDRLVAFVRKQTGKTQQANTGQKRRRTNSKSSDGASCTERTIPEYQRPKALSDGTRVNDIAFGAIDWPSILKDHAPDALNLHRTSREDGANLQVLCSLVDFHTSGPDPTGAFVSPADLKADTPRAALASIHCNHDGCKSRKFATKDFAAALCKMFPALEEAILSGEYDLVLQAIKGGASPAEGLRLASFFAENREQVEPYIQALHRHTHTRIRELRKSWGQLRLVLIEKDANRPQGWREYLVREANDAVHGAKNRKKTSGTSPEKSKKPASSGGVKMSFTTHVDGKIKHTDPHNIIVALSHMGVVPYYNEITSDYHVDGMGSQGAKGFEDGQSIDDPVINHLRLEVKKQFGVFQRSKDDFVNTIEAAAYQNRRNPPRNYFDGLEWDGEARLDNLATETLGADNTPYNRAVVAKALVAVVRRVRTPGEKFDQMLVLEGKGGLGKSTFLRTLVGDEWFTDSPIVRDDDAPFMQSIQGNLVAEMAELDDLGRTGANRVKQLLSRTVDTARLPYRRKLLTMKRVTIFIGTTNEDAYLRDATGNRRFWPVVVKGKPHPTDNRFYIDIDWVARNRDQLWAEAAFRESEGELLYLQGDLADAAEVQQRIRFSDLESDLGVRLEEITGGHNGPEGYFIAGELREHFDDDFKPGWVNKKITGIMEAFGFERTTKRIDKIPTKIWRRGGPDVPRLHPDHPLGGNENPYQAQPRAA